MKRRRFTRDLSCMAMDKEIGAGRYGTVFKTTDRVTGKRFALKHIKMEAETQGFPVTAIREIKILKALEHDNIIKLEEVITYGNQTPDEKDDQDLVHSQGSNMDLSQFLKGSVFMVFEYVEFDLSALILSMKNMTYNHIRCYMKQLLSGIFYMHRQKILHRDLKTANILITRGNVLKIADWGLARSFFTNMQRLSPKVVTLWYRSPELLLETKKYGPEIDIWSAGCIFGELVCSQAILPGGVELEQLDRIFQLCGTPPAGGEVEARLQQCDGWAKMIDFDGSSTPVTCTSGDSPPAGPTLITSTYPSRLKNKFSNSHLGQEGVDLIEKMLCLHPERRITATDALDHQYFWENNGTPPPDKLPPLCLEDAHEAEVTKKRQKKAEERMARSKTQSTSGRTAGGGASKYRLKGPPQRRSGAGHKMSESGSMMRSQSDRNVSSSGQSHQQQSSSSLHKSSSAITLASSSSTTTSSYSTIDRAELKKPMPPAPTRK